MLIKRIRTNTFIILTALISLIGIVGYSILNARQIINSNRQSLLMSTEEIADKLDHLLVEGLRKVRVVSEFIPPKQFAENISKEKFNYLIENDMFDFIMYVDGEGNKETFGDNIPDLDRTDVYNEIISGKTSIGIISGSSNDELRKPSPVILFGAPINTNEGYIIAAYNVDSRINPFIETEYLNVKYKTYLYDQKGRVVTSIADDPLLLSEISFLDGTFDYTTLLENPGHSFMAKLKYNRTGACFVTLPETGWILSRVYPRILSHKIISRANFLGYVYGMFVVLFMVLLFLIGRKEEKARRKELQDAYDEARKANEAKTSFLFNMSHDIRTPMNAIVGFTDLLKKNLDDKEKALDYIEKIQRSNKFLLSLVNNVLEMARIESGKDQLDLDVLEVQPAVDGFLASFDSLMKEKGIDFISGVDVQHEYIISDRTKIQEVYLNLLSNALKYTPTGGTVAFILKEVPCSEEGYVIFRATVSDTGIGMSPDFLPHIYDAFSREKSSTDSKVMGTGLGMPIVKKIIELFGGTINCESILGKGTKFTIELKHRIANENELKRLQKEPEVLSSITYEGKRVLLAEDNDLNAEIAIAILEELGLSVERAGDGIICFDMLEKSTEGYYDIILMDIQMPNLNGYDTTRKIRQLTDPYKSKIPIIAMTANAFESDRKAAFESGMNGHLAKPIDIAQLLQTLDTVLK